MAEGKAGYIVAGNDLFFEPGIVAVMRNKIKDDSGIETRRLDMSKPEVEADISNNTKQQTG
ncbi:MAG: hypothetical protein KIY12_09000 [Thermoplasmata archaeon]|uniref:Uncharacterized protein n=1 Tax=Candidatus Sysuiplasma superficiale TaxID=2823368 RepID=A0A8J8CF05_9ARCH|nr:hypothetical protein [Candidatus Sysuiplasma superficiale]MBX8644838.1 hypothetical protein [Candidatus Sysuiplasma superficiale]